MQLCSLEHTLPSHVALKHLMLLTLNSLKVLLYLSQCIVVLYFCFVFFTIERFPLHRSLAGWYLPSDEKNVRDINIARSGRNYLRQFRHEKY